MDAVSAIIIIVAALFIVYRASEWDEERQKQKLARRLREQRDGAQ